MGKWAVVNSFLIIALLGGPLPLRAERFFKGDERGVAVRPTNRNQTVATLLGESEHYAPTFYDDHMVTLGDKPVGQFTRVDNAPADFYWHVTDPKDLDIVEAALKADRGRLDEVSPRILQAFLDYRSTVPAYEQRGLYGKVLTAVKDITSVAPQRVIGDESLSREVDAALFQYLRSNGISDLARLRGKPALIGMLVNKFYLLSTTYFYRDYPYVKAFLPHLEPIKEAVKKEGRPFKVKVFACSTGEEVLTYAIELLEAGIKDFTILASDINEAGLRHAREFRYSYAMIERLPFSTQRKIKKYLRLNPNLGAWEPQDPAFFKERIRYIRQDLLKDLPADLGPRFGPPYDLVSIMNVLFYLQDSAVQARRDYWARMTNPGGILVLHDFSYSVMGGTLGQDWAFKNFLSLNEWVNIRVKPGMTDKERVSFQAAAYAQNPTDGLLVAMVRALAMSGQADAARLAAEEHLKKRPRSAAALDILWGFQSQANSPLAAATLARLARLQPHSAGVLSRLEAAETDRKAKEFLAALKKAQETTMSDHRSRPRVVETLFDFKSPPAGKYAPLRTLLKVYAMTVLQNHYLGQKHTADADRVFAEGLRLAEEALASSPDSPALAAFLDQLVQDRMDFHLESGSPEKALELADSILRVFSPLLASEGFPPRALGAHLSLYRAVALQRLGRPDEARQAAGAATAEFEKALPIMDELLPSRRPFFMGDAGRAFMVRGELLAQAGQKAAADADESRALDLLEEGLSYNPLYGKNLHGWRGELVGRRQAVQNRGGVAPQEGSLIRLSDEEGPYAFSTEVIRYKSQDGADIEATLLLPEDSAPRRPGLVFVHMWARDRQTWWGLPEFLARHGYPSIYMDLRGHGQSRFPDSKHRVSVQDGDSWTKRYVEFPRDVIPAIDLLAAHGSVKDGKVVVLGASLGSPVGILAAQKRREKILGLVMLSPALNYFGVDCREALMSLREAPVFVMAEKTDESYKAAKDFFNAAGGYKTYLETDHVGHGTDALYRDVGLPTVLWAWLEQLQAVSPSWRKIGNSHPLLPIKKK